MIQPRVLIPISLQFSIRYLLRTGLLARLRETAQPVILMAWKDPEIADELRKEGCEVHPMISSRWGADYERARSLVNHWHKRILNSPTTAIRNRRAEVGASRSIRLRRRLRNTYRDALIALPGANEWMWRREEELFRKATNAPEIERQIDSLRIDAAFSITPFVPAEEMPLRICSRRRIPCCTAILSFDNITTRPWIPITFDRYLLWNQHNATQLKRGYPQTRQASIEIVGSPQFDFYWDPAYIWSEGEWRRELGLPEGNPVILFGGGFHTCAPHEPQFLAQLDEAIAKNQLPRDIIILFRRHPVDPIDRWTPVLQKTKHVVCDNPWTTGEVMGHANVRRRDIMKLASTLFHTLVHVNVASTMTVDGAIFDRPQVGPAYDDSPERTWDATAKESYLQEHCLPITYSGGLDIAQNREQLIEAVRSGLSEPGRLREGRLRLVREICTYTDGKSTARVASALTRFLNAGIRAETAAYPAR